MSIVNKFIDSSDFLTATAVYNDQDLTTKAADGYYNSNGLYREQLNGLLGPSFVCEECGIPCGGTITPPGGAQGLYQLEFSAGTEQTDVGAIKIYFNPFSVPDGIRVFYDGVYYNTLASPTNGFLKTTSGVSDAFTIIGSNNACLPTLPDTSDYSFYDGFENNTWLNGTPSPQQVTINSGDDVFGGASEFSTLIVPKPNRLPGLVTIQILGPCNATGWDIEVECPSALPSFAVKALGSGTACDTTDSTLYFARFRGDVNVRPIINNFVFQDSNGQNYAADQNYIMDDNNVITVTNGVVSAINTCT